MKAIGYRGKGFVIGRGVSTAVVVVLLTLLFVAPVHPTEGVGVQIEQRSMSVALDDQGRPWAVWVVDSGDGTAIYYSRWTGNAWQPSRALSAAPEVWEDSPSLAFAPDGTNGEAVAWAAWAASSGPDQSEIRLSHWTGSRWSEPEVVPGTTALAGRQPALAVAAGGELWLAWVGHDGTDSEVFVSHKNGEQWSEPRLVGSDDADPMDYDTQPRLVADGDGKVWAVWVSYEGPFNDEIYSSYWDGSTWSAQQQINVADETPDVWPSLALDEHGQLWVAWHGIADEDTGHWRVFLSHWDGADSAWSDEMLVSSPPGLSADERRPSLAFDSEGRLHLAWAVSAGDSGIASTVWDGAEWSSPVWTGAPVAASAPALIAGREASVLWLDPDGQAYPPVVQQSVQEMTEPLSRSLSLVPAVAAPTVSYVPDRFLAHGDSITLGAYEDVSGDPAIPYPTVLDARLDSDVGPSEVINSGKNSEQARAARDRLKASVQTYRPQYVLIMEGTNDVRRDYSPAETGYAIRLLIKDTRDASGIPGIKILVATITPRLDRWDEDIPATNQEIYRNAGKEYTPVADPWQAYQNYGPYYEFYPDPVHPGTTGLAIVADTFFKKMVSLGWLSVDGIPPTAQITDLPPQVDCSAAPVTWTGDDGGGSGVVDFDVQVKDGSSAWSDWLVGTPETSGVYIGATYDNTLGFRVRARDVTGNVGEYSEPATTQVVDSLPPYEVGVDALGPFKTLPFTASWRGADDCSGVASYDVEYRAGSGAWVRWLSHTGLSSEEFNPTSHQCGEVYSFRVRADDASGNQSAWSDGSTSTTLICQAVQGHIMNIREKPILSAEVSAYPSALGSDPSDATGYYSLFFDGADTYDIKVERDRYGELPERKDLAVLGLVTGADFYLPPLDDLVDNGGYEKASWGDWQRGGSTLPAISSSTHTGDGAALLDPAGGESRLSQSLRLPAGLHEPAVSLMVRLADKADVASTLTVTIVGATTSTHELAVTSEEWAHAWYDVSAFAGETVTIELAVSGDPALIVDEVSLGSAMPGVSLSYLPLVGHNSGAW